MKDIKNICGNPFNGLAEESRWDAFICQDVIPSSCRNCLINWYSICPVNNKDKEKSYKTNIKCSLCPLITPTVWLYDERIHARYPVFKDVDLIIHNPIFILGSIILISDDGTTNTNLRVKIGDGKSKYTSIPFIETSFIQNSKHTDVNNNDNNKINIEFDTIEVLKLLQICKSVQKENYRQLNTEIGDADVKNINNEMKIISEIINKLKIGINSIYGDKIFNEINRN